MTTIPRHRIKHHVNRPVLHIDEEDALMLERDRLARVDLEAVFAHDT